MTAKTKALKGYKVGGYKWSKAVKGYKKSGFFKTKVNGSGHTAGHQWATDKQIDPYSRIRRYSKNSPSFDEGVYAYKQSARQSALENKLND